MAQEFGAPELRPEVRPHCQASAVPRHGKFPAHQPRDEARIQLLPEGGSDERARLCSRPATALGDGLAPGADGEQEQRPSLGAQRGTGRSAIPQVGPQERGPRRRPSRPGRRDQVARDRAGLGVEQGLVRAIARPARVAARHIAHRRRLPEPFGHFHRPVHRGAVARLVAPVERQAGRRRPLCRLSLQRGALHARPAVAGVGLPRYRWTRPLRRLSRQRDAPAAELLCRAPLLAVRGSGAGPLHCYRWQRHARR